jgi:hypothetical protein
MKIFELSSRLFWYIVVFVATFLGISPLAAAQNIPLGSWRTHLSYYHINVVALGEQKVIASGNHGVMILDQRDNSISTYSKINGLTGTSITYVGLDNQTQRLLVTYADGRFDVIDNTSEIVGFDPTKNSTLTGSKKINHIYFTNSIAYLATDYGVIVFDVNRLLVRETWRGLGNNGQPLNVFQSTILGDSIFLATGRGVIAGALKDNLQDYNNWKRFESGEFAGSVQHIAQFDNAVYSGLNGSGIFKYEDAHWAKTPYLEGFSFRSIHSSLNHLFIAETDALYSLATNDDFTPVPSTYIVQPNFATEDNEGNLWIGDGGYGLVTNSQGGFVSIIPNSPFGDKAINLTYYDKRMYALSGGYSANGAALGNSGVFDWFLDGSWTTAEAFFPDVTDLVTESHSGKTYISSFGHGIEVRDMQNNPMIFNDTNSPLINTNPPEPFVNISSLTSGVNGVWVANYGASKPLHFLDANNNWKSFSFPMEQSQYPLKLGVDPHGSVWMVLDPMHSGGITVFNETDNKSVVLTDGEGMGGLPDNAVNAIATDREGYVWIGTDLGVAYFNDPVSVFSGTVNAIKPIYDGRFLLRDDKVTAIAVDGGNRKWIGTERGLWLFNESGEELIYNFTTANSPLLSDVIRDVEINGQTGEVFIATDEGLISFRSDATDSEGKFETVKIFPNPVTATFIGSIGITGLATDALVKITDVNGKLVWQTRAHGGSASWNLQDVNGRRPSTGVYIVFAITDDGRDSAVAKIAFVD